MKTIRKTLAIILVLGCMASALLLLSGCSAKSPLKMDEMYYLTKEVDRDDMSKTSYYIFGDDGRGEYRSYSEVDLSGGNAKIYDYTVTFKYVYMDDEKTTVACFHNGISYGDTHNGGDMGDKFERVLLISDNVLMEMTSADLYVREEFLNEDISKFRK